MADVARFKRMLLSFGEPELRTRWLRSQLLRWPAAHAAALLAELIEEGETGVPAAKEALFSVVAIAIKDYEAPFWTLLREEARRQGLLSLQRFTRQSSQPLVQAAPANELPVPDYGVGHEVTLGERRSLARKPNRKLIDRLIADPHPMVTSLLLRNPKVKESDVVRLASRRPARAEALREIASCDHWFRRTHVRLAILFNPGTPTEISVPLVFLCARQELQQLVASPGTPLVVRATASEILERRSPRARWSTDSATLQ